MISAIDTNVLLDILIPNPEHCFTKRLLDKALAEGALVVCEMVYGELVAQFQSQRRLDMFLQDTGIRLLQSAPETLNLAGLKWFECSQRQVRTPPMPRLWSCSTIYLPCLWQRSVSKATHPGRLSHRCSCTIASGQTTYQR